MTHAPTYTMLVGEPTLTSVEDNKVKAIKGDKVVTEITAVRHLVIAKGIMMDHITQYLNVNKPPPLLLPPLHL